MARLNQEFLERCENFSHRVVDVAEAIAEQRLSRRICEQMIGCGTSVGANMYEADEAMTRKDFVKCLAISSKELSECRFWLRFVGRREWVLSDRLAALLAEADELRKILSTIIMKTQAADGKSRPGQR